jgi:DMSO/TMAO reductase YedYZ molybdopterin-dependent catalytic subunit/predicted amidohydrolase
MRLRRAARRHGIHVSFGFSEATDASVGCLWHSNMLVGPDGAVLNHRRKLVPTYHEKLVWAPGDAEGLRVVGTPLGRIGTLICGENTNPLARYALMAEGEQPHLATFPPVWPTRLPGEAAAYDIEEAIRIRCGAHSFEAKCFTLVASAHLDRTAEGFALTEEGRALMPHAEAMELQAIGIANGRAGPSAAVTGRVRVATMEGIASQYLARRLPRLAEKHRNLLVEPVTSRALFNLTKREADISLAFVPVRGPKLEIRRIGAFALFLYASPGYLAEHGTPAGPEDLARHRVVDYVEDLVQIPDVHWLLDVVSPPAGLLPLLLDVRAGDRRANGAGLVLLPSFAREMIEGMVRRPLLLAPADIEALPQVRLHAVHQCAGNPQQPTVATRRVACAVWEGARLADILRDAAVEAGAAFLWSDGADGGSFAGTEVPFHRKGLPLGRLPEDVLLATRLNGAPIPDEHGGPIRLVVPGFYGTNSVKWLWRLTAAERRADGLFTTTFYNDRLPDGSVRPVWALAPEAVFTTPAPNDQVSGTTQLRGWAWSDAPVERVDVSDDAGATWQPARLAPREGRAWQACSVAWAFRRRGPTRLLCRATDASGASQPMDGARNAAHVVEVHGP